MQFVPAIDEPVDRPGPSWWFAFHENRLLVEGNGPALKIPFGSDPAGIHVAILRRQYLGQLDGYPCFSAELETPHIPEGMRLLGLMKIYQEMGEDVFGIAGRAFQIINWDRTHQYCGRCGIPTIDKPNERAKVCPQCGLLRYPRLSPAVIVAVVKGNQLLLAHSGRFPGKFYSVLAGFVEPGETFEECVEREVKEEVGLTVDTIRYFGSQPWPFPDSMMIGFTARCAGGEIRIDENEITDARWFTADNLPRIPGKISIARRLIDWFVEHHPPAKKMPVFDSQNRK
jgi:NAD+ diphosphatase